MSILFTPVQLGSTTLQNRLAMAPMTRCRAIGNVPGALMAEYYGQRGDGGLLITEGTSPSPNGLGYPRIPGIFSAEQVAGWKPVTVAAKARGAKIFVQLMHCGRVGHPVNLPDGARLLAPSAVAAAGEMYTDAKGPQPHPVPQSMTEADVAVTIAEFAKAATNAISAGFDGVELHAANGYLLEQFIRPTSNLRGDRFGGSIANRARFVLETVDAVRKAIGAERIGIRLSPYGVFNDMPPYDGMEADYLWLIEALDERGLAYLHLVDHAPMGAPPVPDSMKVAARELFKGALVLSGGYDAARAEADLAAGKGDLVAVGRPYLANPDLPLRWKTGAPLNEVDMNTFYTPGAEGYTDYPALEG